MSEKKSAIWNVLIIVVILALVAGMLWMWQKQRTTEQEMSDVVELMNYEREQLEAEYEDIAFEMEGFSGKINNDSLLKKLDREQQRVQMLLEELRTVKSTNARRITELKKELASVRQVLVYYVAQVDSLNQINAKLTYENRQVRERYEETSKTLSVVSQEKTKLEEKMVLASQLEARNVTVRTLTSKERKTKSIRRTDIIEVDFSILKNISTPVGMKTVYMRITTPDNTVLTKNPSATFKFENRELEYSAKKDFEFKGEDMQEVLYYTVTETLWAGNYRVDLFIDGHLVGTASFKLEK